MLRMSSVLVALALVLVMCCCGVSVVQTSSDVNSSTNIEPMEPSDRASDFGRPMRRNRRNAAPYSKNMCSVDGCSCRGKAVQCHVHHQELKLNNEFQLHLNTTSFNITLSGRARLIVQKDFFRNNEVQLLQVTGGEHFELTSNAMDGNSRALFPQIEIVGCSTVVFGSRAFAGEVKLNVTDVNTLFVFKETFYGTGFQALFLRVADLRIGAGALHGADISSRVNVVDSHVDDLLPLQMSIREIRFEGSTINRIKENAFNGMEVRAIEFRNCHIRVIEALAFSEKILIDSMNFAGCTIYSFETGAIQSGIRTLILENNTITRIHTAAIAAHVVKLQITKNTIVHADELWLNLDNWSNVSIATNSFGQFGRINLEVVPKQVVCAFRDNLVALSLNECLYFGYANCDIKNITFNQHCLCDQPWPRKMFLNGPLDGQLQEINCLVDETIRSCYNTTHMKASEHQQVCNDNNKPMDCAKDQRTQMIIEFPTFGDDHGPWNLKQVVMIAGSVVVLAVSLIAVIVLCRNLRKTGAPHDRRTNNVTCSETVLTGSDSGSDASRDHHQRSKSFSVNDRAIIRQTLHTMKGHYPSELYDQVFNNTMKVLNNGLDEPEQVAAIGEIIEALRECQKLGGDFVAFTDILYRQLEPKEETPPMDAIYAEVGGAANDGSNGNNDNVYAEPHQHLQRCPLLNEYSSPVDNDMENYAEYAEPHRLNGTSRRIISPYAIVSTAASAPSLPASGVGPSKNLPDVLPHHRPAMTLYEPQHSKQSISSHHPPPPIYSEPIRKPSSATAGPSSSLTQQRIASRAKERTPPDEYHTHSDHSGGSSATIPMDDIAYVDS